MAKLILPADAVPIYLSPKIQADLVARQVFPNLRRERALETRSNGALTYSATVEDARALETDARRQEKAAHPSRKWGYRCLANSLEESIHALPERVERLAAKEAGRCSSWRGEGLFGTKEQIQAVGIGIGMPFPGEPGAKRWFLTRDSRGYPAKVSHSNSYPHWLVFDVEIRLPKEIREQRECEERCKQQAAEKVRLETERLKALPKSADEFRDSSAQRFWFWAGATLDLMSPDLGIRYDADTIEEVKDALSEAYWKLKEGATEGQTATAVWRSRARADKPLQSFLARIQRERPEGL